MISAPPPVIHPVPLSAKAWATSAYGFARLATNMNSATVIS